MAGRTELRDILDAEMRRWSSMSFEQLKTALEKVQAYEIEIESRRYQIEVQLLEDTDEYVHVLIGVMDGSFRRFIAPLNGSFICKKDGHS
jgi:hypothetical protein